MTAFLIAINLFHWMKNETPTLVILTPGFPKNEEDTTCLPAQQSFVTALNRQYPQLKVIILTLQYPFTKTSYTWRNNTVIGFAGMDKGKLTRLLTWFHAWKTLKRLKKENNLIGLLSFWCTECALLGK